MDIQPNSILLKDIPTQNLISYLGLTGWNLVKSPNEKWLIYQGAKDVEGNPFEIVLLKNFLSKDSNLYLSSAINLLSALKEESPEQIVKRVKYYDHDVLSVRNLETGGYDSISIELATHQITNLKGLVAYSACSTDNPRPYFGRKSSKLANKMVSHYRLGHTFQGSFGLTLQSQVRNPYSLQLSLFNGGEDEEPFIIPPIERRVMERIVRGLIRTHQATIQQDPQLLVQGYTEGFNGNMCQNIVKMSNDFKPLEYSVMWSPKIKLEADLRDNQPINLTEVSYSYLESAIDLLKETKLPQVQTIRGLVTGLTSEENPFGDNESERSIIIKWQREDIRPTKILVTLSKNDYLLAIKAHESWSTVTIRGIPNKIGNHWVLSDPQDFKPD